VSERELIADLLRPGQVPSLLSGLDPGAVDPLAHISVAPSDLAECVQELTAALAAVASQRAGESSRALEGLELAARLFLRAATDTHLVVGGILRFVDVAVREEVDRRLSDEALPKAERARLLADFAPRQAIERPAG